MATPNEAERKTSHWTVVSDDIVKDVSGNRYITCRCICGVEKLVFKQDLIRGKSFSCIDCSRVSDPEKFIRIKAKHNLIGNLKDLPPYRIWGKMKDRCENKKSKRFPDYGGRGIFVEESFRDYLDFIDWSYSNGYSPELTIERIDVNKGYCSSNCKWIPLSEQSRNKRKYRNNRSGVTGVWEKPDRWVCYWYDVDGKFKTKSFSINKYGYAESKNKAIEYRKLQIYLLEKSGILYGEFHGK